MSDVEYEPPLFDLPAKGRTPPIPELTACDRVGPRTAWTDPVDQREKARPPKCNRTAGHDGPCRRINRRSFGVEAEWS